MNDVISETVNLLEASMLRKSISLKNNSEEEFMVIADIDMIKTVFRNLLSNAIKFTSENGQITIKQNYKNNMIIVSIQDTGVGIEKERINKLFKFVENESTRGTDGEKGTGLGLVLSNEFVQKNKGKMWVESTIGLGSTFYISLPAKISQIC